MDVIKSKINSLNLNVVYANKNYSGFKLTLEKQTSLRSNTKINGRKLNLIYYVKFSS